MLDNQGSSRVFRRKKVTPLLGICSDEKFERWFVTEEILDGRSVEFGKAPHWVASTIFIVSIPKLPEREYQT